MRLLKAPDKQAQVNQVDYVQDMPGSPKVREEKKNEMARNDHCGFQKPRGESASGGGGWHDHRCQMTLGFSHTEVIIDLGQEQLWERAMRPSVAATAAKSFQSCPTLCDPQDGSPPGSPVPGILQARTLEWVAISFSNA